MLCGEDNIGRKREFEPAPAADAIHRRDDGFVETAQLLQAPKPALAVIAIDCIAIGGGLQIPAGAEEFLARPCDDGHSQLSIIAKFGEDFAHNPAGRQIDGIGLGPVERDLKDMAACLGFDRVGHSASLL